MFYFILFFLCLVDLRICVYLSRAKPWLELSIKFNRYSMKSFQTALVGFNNLWIHLIFKEFCWVSMFKIPSLPFQMKSCAICLGDRFFFALGEIVFSFFSFLSDTFWNSIYFTYVPWIWSKDFLSSCFFPLKEGCILFQIWIFYVKLSCILSQILWSWGKLPKRPRPILMENLGQTI